MSCKIRTQNIYTKSNLRKPSRVITHFNIVTNLLYCRSYKAFTSENPKIAQVQVMQIQLANS